MKFLYCLPTIYAKNTEIPTMLYIPFFLKFLFYFVAVFLNMWIELYDIY